MGVTPPEARRTSAISLVSRLIKALQDYTLFPWKSCNDVLHEAGSDGLASVHVSLNHDISQMYSIHDTFSPNLRSYFTKSSLSLSEALLNNRLGGFSLFSRLLARPAFFCGWISPDKAIYSAYLLDYYTNETALCCNL